MDTSLFGCGDDKEYETYVILKVSVMTNIFFCFSFGKIILGPRIYYKLTSYRLFTSGYY